MAAIFEPITIGWRGEEYTITPTMRLLNQVEQRVSLSAIAHHLSIGEPRLSHIATALSVLLQAAGVKVSDGEVYQELMSADAEEITAMATAVVAAAFPARPEGKRGNARAPNKSAKRPK